MYVKSPKLSDFMMPLHAAQRRGRFKCDFMSVRAICGIKTKNEVKIVVWVCDHILGHKADGRAAVTVCKTKSANDKDEILLTWQYRGAD